MKRISLQLDRAFPTKISIEAKQDGDPSVRYNVASQVATAVSAENDRKWMVTLALDLVPASQKKPTYVISIEYAGFFTIEKSVPADKVENLVTVNGPSMLYSAARELISLLTARGPWPEVTLMTVTFIDAAKGCSGNKTEPSRLASETVGVDRK